MDRDLVKTLIKDFAAINGEVVLFGIRGGDFRIQDFSRMIVKGITIKNVIGRRIFETWEITKNLLESKENKIQEKKQSIVKGKEK